MDSEDGIKGVFGCRCRSENTLSGAKLGTTEEVLIFRG